MSLVAQMLPVGLALIMLTVGLSLTFSDFLDLYRRPLAVATGLVAQILLLPCLAIGLLGVADLPPDLALGVLLVASAPGGVTSSLLTLLAGGDVALAITITAISTIASVLTLPVSVAIGAEALGLAVSDVAMPVGTVMLGILTTTVLPLTAGMALRARWPAAVARLAVTMRKMSTAIFAAIVAYTFFQSAGVLRTHGLTLGPLVLALNALAFAGAALLARAARLGRPQLIAIATETGLQNAALAIVVAVSVLQRPALAMPAVIFAVTMNVLILLLIPLGRRFAAATPRGAPP